MPHAAAVRREETKDWCEGGTMAANTNQRRDARTLATYVLLVVVLLLIWWL